MTELIVRVLAPGDEDTLTALYAECFDEPFGETGFRRLLASPGMWASLAWRDDPAGRLAVGYVMARSVADEAEIVSIGVRPAERRKGVATTLLADAMCKSVVLGARTIFLEVSEENAAAISLYETAGFEKIGRRPDYYRRKTSSPIAALIMRYVVNKSVS